MAQIKPAPMTTAEMEAMKADVTAHHKDHPKPKRQATTKKSVTFDDVFKAAKGSQNGAAKLFARLAVGRFICERSGSTVQWFRCKDGVWCEDRIAEPLRQLDGVQELFLEYANKLQAQMSDAVREGQEVNQKSIQKQRDTLMTAAEALNRRQYRLAVLDLAAAGEGYLVCDSSVWDTASYTLPCRNGVINLRALESPDAFRELRPEDYTRITANVDYDPSATCPVWEQFLLSTFDNDKVLIHHLQKIVGYSVCRDPREHKLFIFYGCGRNGKSVLIETIQKVLGKLTAHIEPELILDQGRKRQAGGASPDKLQLRGKGLCTCSELSANSRLDVAMVKNLTGGDTIAGRALYSNTIEEFDPTHVLVLLTNHLPRANADEYAFWKRVQAVPFKLSFVDEPKAEHERKIDKELPSKLEAERAGILNWIIQGAAAWQKEGLDDVPHAVKAATAEYQRGEDTLQDFLEACCVIRRGISIQSSVLYRAYKAWCEESGIRPCSLIAFGKGIKAKGFKGVPRNNGTFYEDIGLLSSVVEVVDFSS